MGGSLDFFFSFLYSQFLVTLPKPTKSFSGQTIIVTGSNIGLGLEAARHFSHLNATLIILAVRNLAKGEAAKASILASTGRDPISIEVWSLDMQSYDSIKAFCSRASKLRRLDAVLANAGMMTKYFNMVAGFESCVTTNIIGTFLLVLGVLPKLEESAAEFKTQSKLSIVASDLHFVAKFPERESEDIFAALNHEKSAKLGMERYAVTKLIQVLVVRELGSRAASKSSNVIVNCMTPGACKTDFHRESTGVGRIFDQILAALFGRTAEAGSRTLVAAISAGEESQGEYMADCKVEPPGPLVQGSEGMALQKKVWNQLIQNLEIIQPGISQDI